MSARAHGRAGRAMAAWVAVAALAAASPAQAQTDQLSWKDAQAQFRTAVRDTAGRGGDPAALTALGVALVQMARLPEAERVLERALAAGATDGRARAALGKALLFRGQAARAESLLASAQDAEGAVADLYAARLRRGDWSGAVALAEAADDAGRVALLERMAEQGAFTLREDGPERVSLLMQRVWPVPLIRARLNGHEVVLAVDPGAPDLLLDPATTRVHRVETVPGERGVFWNGGRVAARNGWVRSLDLGGLVLEDVPAAVTPLQKYSLTVNPQGRYIQGVIGASVLRRLGLTLDFRRQRVELRRPGTAYAPAVTPVRVPFEWWGEHELTVYGSLAGGRRMALLLGTGLPEGGVGLPQETTDELGLKPDILSRMAKGAGAVLQGRAWSAVVVPTVSFGAVVQDKVPAWNGAFDSRELWRHGVRRDALIGPDTFTRRRVSFDWDAMTLLFESKD